MKYLKNALLPTVIAYTLLTTGLASAYTVAEIVQSSPSASVMVFVENGIATISGTVEESSVIDTLESAVHSLDNISAVNNEIVLVRKQVE